LRFTHNFQNIKKVKPIQRNSLFP